MQWMISPARLAMAAMLSGAVFVTAGCSTTGTVGAKAEIRETVRGVVGTDLIGARGATARDQNKIDATAAGLCGAGVWTRSECARYDAAKSRGGW